jgi:hypothetical protein
MGDSFHSRVERTRARLDFEAKRSREAEQAQAESEAQETRRAAEAANRLLPELSVALASLRDFDLESAQPLRTTGTMTLREGSAGHAWLMRIYAEKRPRFHSGFRGWRISREAGAIELDAHGAGRVAVGNQTYTLDAAADRGIFEWTWVSEYRYETSSGKTKVVVEELFQAAIDVIVEYVARSRLL